MSHRLEKSQTICTLALSKTSQLPTAPSTGLRLGSWPPSMLSLRRHSSTVCVSSVGHAWVRARSCSRDSELWTPREHSWSWASASLQLETIEAFTQRCWLWHSDTMVQSHRCDDGDWCEVSGGKGDQTWGQRNIQSVTDIKSTVNPHLLHTLLLHILTYCNTSCLKKNFYRCYRIKFAYWSIHLHMLESCNSAFLLFKCNMPVSSLHWTCKSAHKGRSHSQHPAETGLAPLGLNSWHLQTACSLSITD